MRAHSRPSALLGAHACMRVHTCCAPCSVVQRERVHKQLVETLRRVRQTRDNLSTTLTGEQLFQVGHA